MMQGSKNPFDGMFIDTHEKLVDGQYCRRYRAYYKGKLVGDDFLYEREAEAAFFKYVGRRRPM